MKCAAAEFGGQNSEREAVFDVLLDVAAHRAPQRRLRIAVDRLGAAAQAGAVAGLLGRYGVVEELHVFPLRTACWTRRPAKDARARYGEDDSPAEGAIALDYGFSKAGPP